MPKERRAKSSSLDRAMVSPYSCSSKTSNHDNRHSSLLDVGDEKEWEEARCPICIEHPHNAVRLHCSSWEKGCCPFICDTSYRHSNCLDQFRRSAVASSVQILLGEQQTKLTCPLCRGVITGWDVIHPARRFMNSKARSCSLETCSFSGNYDELRKHARLEHPFERPSEASPTRQSNWERLEQEREMEDALAHQSDIDLDIDGWLSWWDEWSDLWGDGSFLDFPSGMPGIEDDLADGLYISLPFSLFSLDSPSLEEDLIDSGSSRSRNRLQRTSIPTNSGSRYNNRARNVLPRSRSNNHARNALPGSRSRSSFAGGSRANISRLRSDYRRESDAVNLRSTPTYRRGNHSGISTQRESYRRENTSARSNNHREYTRPRSRTGSG